MYEILLAAMDLIKSELDRCYFNEYQKEMSSPFDNTGTVYFNDFFKVRAYNWDDEGNVKPNFESVQLNCWWYKHSHRGFMFEIKDSALYDSKELNEFLKNCLEAIRKDFTLYGGVK